ncbi:hypothetical protein LBMAG47_32400 [Planctomycetia bacterium]|nr:hypothetical protein LBMAG47_32400 [Planctomycetia bacterium]
MIGIVRDIVRAVLVVVVLAVSLEMLQAHREAAGRLPPPPAWQPVHSWPQATNERPNPPAWQPMQTVVIQPPPPAQPIRRVAGSFVDLADSLIGVIR